MSEGAFFPPILAGACFRSFGRFTLCGIGAYGRCIGQREIDSMQSVQYLVSRCFEQYAVACPLRFNLCFEGRFVSSSFLVASSSPCSFARLRRVSWQLGVGQASKQARNNPSASCDYPRPQRFLPPRPHQLLAAREDKEGEGGELTTKRGKLVACLSWDFSGRTALRGP